MRLAVGNLIDERYRVLRLVGEGGMGFVYLAENVRIDRKVALKVLHPHLAVMEEMVERFEREARAAARIGSPHIADVLDLGFLPTGERFVVMEYLEGESLASRVKARGGRMTPREIAPITMQLLEGLAEVHAAGIVHRDLKPANVFLARAPGRDADFVKILDFGVSKFRGADALTTEHHMLGTPTYMAPEHARGDEVDPRTDLYSVGAVLYRCVTGMPPFAADNYLELLLKIDRAEPRRLRALAPDVDLAFGRIVEKAMQKSPAARFSSATEMREALKEWYGGIDSLLADFLGIARTPTPLPPARARVVSKVVVEEPTLSVRKRARESASSHPPPSRLVVSRSPNDR